MTALKHPTAAPRRGGAKPSSAPPPGSAQLWVDTNGGSCRRSAAPRTYVDGQACSSLQSAYNAARTGDTVGIRTGVYPGQTLSAGTKGVTFRAAGPGRPRFGHFVSAATNITVRGILIEDRSEQNGACNTAPYGVLTPCGRSQTYDNVIVDGLNSGDKHGIETPGDGFTLKNGEIRNIRDRKGFEGGADNMLIENNYWHNITITAGGAAASTTSACTSPTATTRSIATTVSSTARSWPCSSPTGPEDRPSAASWSRTTSSPHASTTTATGTPCPALLLGGGFNNQNTWFHWTVRYNTFESAVYVGRAPGGSSEWYGNLGAIDCVPAFTYSYNVGETCGGKGEVSVKNATNDARNRNRAPFYMNAPASDFRLRVGAAAIDRGNPRRIRQPTRPKAPPRRTRTGCWCVRVQRLIAGEFRPLAIPNLTT